MCSSDLMLEARAARSARRLRANAGSLNMPGSPSFHEGANDNETGPNVPPPPGVFLTTSVGSFSLNFSCITSFANEIVGMQ